MCFMIGTHLSIRLKQKRNSSGLQENGCPELLQQKQYFLFRVSSVFFKAYLDQVQDGEDR